MTEVFLRKLLHMAIVRSFEVMPGQMLNHSLQNTVSLCNIILLLIILFVVIKFHTTFFNLHDNSIILKPQFHFMAICIKGVLSM
jgi:uncharacterized membrane protein YdbT with pleckstrin-like domain